MLFIAALLLVVSYAIFLDAMTTPIKPTPKAHGMGGMAQQHYANLGKKLRTVSLHPHHPFHPLHSLMHPVPVPEHTHKEKPVPLNGGANNGNNVSNDLGALGVNVP
jgi:hypothetical protein